MMNADQELHRRGKEIFDIAADLRPIERVEYLERECGDDPVLRAHVERLLAGDAEPARLPPLVSIASLLDEFDLVGQRIGKYRVVRRIGAGGMGTVYEAAQESPSRPVAIKLMHHAVPSRQALRRFDFEVEVLGRLQHPGIAHVYEAGTVEIAGRPTPFFAMELIRGARTIDQFADERSLSLRERVELFTKVCDAVHYGHQNLVVHRDLKPGNILVDDSGQPKIIDFGVARSTNSDLALTTLQTHVGELLGTLAYMSPEQCGSDPRAIDTRSDVYSLGVVLYELLCGCAPYDMAELSIPAATRVIREFPPRPPSSIRRALKGDLDAILLKALDKEPGARYASTAAFGSDLRRFLSGQPIDARLPGPWKRALAWTAVHPLLVTAGTCALFVLTSVGSIWAAYEVYAHKPDRIEIDSRGRTASLYPRFGPSVHDWKVERDGAIRHALIVDRPDAMGGGRLAVLGHRYRPSVSGENAELDVYDLREPSRLLWSSSQHPLVQPAGEPDRPQAFFGVELVVAADMLPELPGDELLVVHVLDPYSACAIRIYDLTGALRYEVWHDGVVLSAVWLSEPGLVLMSGVESQYRWDRRGFAVVGGAGSYPAVVFALRPRDGHRAEPHWIVRDGERRDATVEWYRWIGPAEIIASLGKVEPYLSSQTGTLSQRRHARITLRSEQPGLVHMILGPDGRDIERWSDDDYKRARDAGALPSEVTFRLLDYEGLPPPMPPTAASEADQNATAEGR